MLFKTLGIAANDKKSLRAFSAASGVPVKMLNFYEHTNTFPSGTDLEAICKAANILSAQLMLGMGRLDRHLIAALQNHAGEVFKILENDLDVAKPVQEPAKQVFSTALGKLYQGDCMALLQQQPSESIDLVFADPPFNLNKLYPSGIDDDMKESQYLDWCEAWATECVRVLKPGGSLLIWNLPKWNTHMAGFLNGRMTFRHNIAVDIKYSLPIAGRLYPSNYSLLFYCKGDKPRAFHPDRLPMEICPSCYTDLRDYGGYKDKMNPLGVNLADVWYDISPVRHAKYKKRKEANELPLRLMDRIIEMASDPGDLVFDPFGGAGTTYVAAELKGRHWLGVEIGPPDVIIDRFANIEDDQKHLEKIRKDYNRLFTEKSEKERLARGMWTCETVRKGKLTMVEVVNPQPPRQGDLPLGSENKSELA